MLKCVSFWLQIFCGWLKGWNPVNRFTHTSWTTVVTPTDRPKSVRNLCVIKDFGVVLVLSLDFHFLIVWSLCHRTVSDLFLLFSYDWDLGLIIHSLPVANKISIYVVCWGFNCKGWFIMFCYVPTYDVRLYYLILFYTQSNQIRNSCPMLNFWTVPLLSIHINQLIFSSGWIKTVGIPWAIMMSGNRIVLIYL